MKLISNGGIFTLSSSTELKEFKQMGDRWISLCLPLLAF